MSDFKPAARRKARHMAMQALYQWHISKASANEIEAQFMVDQNMEKVDKSYFHELLHQVTGRTGELDELLGTVLDRKVSELTPVEMAILRLGAYELQHRIDVPYRVVINEGVELAKSFGATEGHRYVNGVLDKLSRTLRQAEQAR
ncbi:transcription antitermination factor NusB [Natronospirillum operosum]|uniref:Transcription antitermination protein NusB n=1 Tax=Natronospirillum operosum TaxID=2759953 RepID=A0A4Z0W4R6_9GAMM|nr:transcription antitermination factor NusB [Natronospirillum operosum]TGG90375.1 transcription antitermination factor NusB [Natronospirillum operosum]